MTESKNKYLTLFLNTLFISTFTFGGGYVIVPLLKKKFVEDLKLIDEDEMINLVAISQSTPGAIAINASLLIGYKTAGLLGAIVATLGTVIPPFTIITIISFFYVSFRDNPIVNSVMNTMQPLIAAIIFDVVINMGTTIIKKKEPLSIILMALAFILNYFFKVNVIILMLSAGIISLALGVLEQKNKNDGGLK